MEYIGKVGPTYGRKMMGGFLKSHGFRVAEQRIGESLHRVDPVHHTIRRNLTIRSINPRIYIADYFGQKLQNEKITMFGVTHVCAIDGFSNKIVGFVSMPIKSNEVIYEKLYKWIVTEYGMFDRIIVDKGKEWNLLLFINETLRSFRHDTSKSPHVQVSSKKVI